MLTSEDLGPPLPPDTELVGRPLPDGRDSACRQLTVHKVCARLPCHVQQDSGIIVANP